MSTVTHISGFKASILKLTVLWISGLGRDGHEFSLFDYREWKCVNSGSVIGFSGTDEVINMNSEFNELI